MNSFNITPSFYDTEEEFEKYLAQTSYYVSLQNAVSRLVSFCNSKSLLELGTGTGSTALRLSKENPNCSIISIDIRQKMVDSCNDRYGSNKLHFINEDMVSYVTKERVLSEFIVMLYSFHHITDPLQNKIDFLNICYDKLPVNGRLCIAETFLPEHFHEPSLTAKVAECWARRIHEGYASTFWSSLRGLDQKSIEKAKIIAQYSMDNENRAGRHVLGRDDEYLVSFEWLVSTAQALGFVVEIAEPCNTIGEAVVLLKKV